MGGLVTVFGLIPLGVVFGSAGPPIAIVCGLLVGGWRAARLAVVVDPRGVIIRNSLRDYRIGWDEVACFTDGAVDIGSSNFTWAVGVGTTMRERKIDCVATILAGRTTTQKIVDTIRETAERYGKPCTLTGTRRRHTRRSHRRDHKDIEPK
jgi:hypothetical protein